MFYYYICVLLEKCRKTADTMEMQSLNLPEYDIHVRDDDGRSVVFDVLRRKYVALTPEEWVRQHFVNYLIRYRHYPAGRIANEVELRIGEKRLRCDSVVYDSRLRPQMVIEYKAPGVSLTRKVLDQVMDYNLLLHADYITISNGLQHVCCMIDYEKRSQRFLEDIPTYDIINERTI